MAEEEKRRVNSNKSPRAVRTQETGPAHCGSTPEGKGGPDEEDTYESVVKFSKTNNRYQPRFSSANSKQGSTQICTVVDSVNVCKTQYSTVRKIKITKTHN